MSSVLEWRVRCATCAAEGVKVEMAAADGYPVVADWIWRHARDAHGRNALGVEMLPERREVDSVVVAAVAKTRRRARRRARGRVVRVLREGPPARGRPPIGQRVRWFVLLDCGHRRQVSSWLGRRLRRTCVGRDRGMLCGECSAASRKAGPFAGS